MPVGDKMLKKLVKYGNSNALILDRAILELLNIKEGAVLKLHTDGKSLIITPEQTTKEEHVSMSGVERVNEYLQSIRDAAEAQKGQLAGTENYEKLQEAVKEIMAKHSNAIAGYDHQAFLSEVDALAEKKYQGNRSSPEFIMEVKALQAQYSPGLAKMQQEMADAAKKFGY